MSWEEEGSVPQVSTLLLVRTVRTIQAYFEVVLMVCWNIRPVLQVKLCQIIR